jgi:hypothetical protein
MLVHQLRRINSPAVLVTSCDAQFFPLLQDSDCSVEGMFDRVLCDVPCSGDGTTRKNPGIWRHWSALGSLALHPLQLAIALNGARLTKVGRYKMQMNESISYYVFIQYNSPYSQFSYMARRIHLLFNVRHESH